MDVWTGRVVRGGLWGVRLGFQIFLGDAGLWKDCRHWFPGESLQEPWQLSRNQEVNVIHVDDVMAFIEDVDHWIVSNDTLIFDYTFFLHPVRPPSPFHCFSIRRVCIRPTKQETLYGQCITCVLAVKEQSKV